MKQEPAFAAVGARLRSLRGKESRMSFAERFGVSVTSLSRWESGENAPDLAFLQGISKTLPISLDWLLTGKEAAEASPHAVDEQLSPLSVSFPTRHQSVAFQTENAHFTEKLIKNGLFDKFLLLQEESRKMAFAHADLRVEHARLLYENERLKARLEDLLQTVSGQDKELSRLTALVRERETSAASPSPQGGETSPSARKQG